jgi:hypothetical protein
MIVTAPDTVLPWAGAVRVTEGEVVSGTARVVADTEVDGIDSFPAASHAVTV